MNKSPAAASPLALLSNRGMLASEAALGIGFAFALVQAADSPMNRPNILLICVDDLRPELACFGKTYIHSPNIDRLAATGRRFARHYVQSPTCGASRYTLLTGRYGPSQNEALFMRADRMAEEPATVSPSMPEWFHDRGYTSVAVGKVSHHPGGLGGPDWNDPEIPEMPGAWQRSLMPVGPWQHPRGAMHGLANGEIRVRSSEMDVMQSAEGPDTTYPDGLIAAEAISQLQTLSAQPGPFLLAVGYIRPHLPFGAPQKYAELYVDSELPEIPHPEVPQGRTTWHGSSEFKQYNRWHKNPNEDGEFADALRRHYAACVTYADTQVGKLLDQLDELDISDNTIVILWGDHGFHLGEHGIWGKHALFEESLHSPLIIRYPGIPEPGASTDAVVETLDLFPTLCELTGYPVPAYTQGSSLLPQLRSPTTAGHAAISYRRAHTIRTPKYRLVDHLDGYVELYDHSTTDAETRNIASLHPDVVERLKSQLNERLAGE